MSADLALPALAVLALLLAPGPTNTLLAAAGANGGVRKALPLLACEAAGYAIAIGGLRAGLGPLVAVSPPLGAALRLACGAWLAWTAFRLWRACRTGFSPKAGVTGLSVFFATALNPKALVLAYGVFPSGTTWSLAESAMVASGVAFGGSTWIVIGALLGRTLDRHAGQATLNRVAAAVMAIFAGLVSAFALSG